MSVHISRRRLLTTTAGGIVLGLSGCLDTADDEATDWPTRGYDVGNSGYAPDVRGPTDDAEVAWTADLEADRAGSPIVYNDQIYVGTNRGDMSKFPRGHVVALNRGGNKQWRYLADRAIDGPLTATADGVYGGTRAGVVVALDHEGKRRWRYDLDTGTTVRVKATNDRVYATSGGRLVALDATGTVLWKYEVEKTPGITGIPTIGERGAYVGGGAIWAVDDEGSRRWVYDKEDYRATPPVLADGTLYAAERPVTTENVRLDESRKQAQVVAVDVDGTVQWRASLPFAGGRRVADDRLLVSGEPGLVALDVTTGNELWRYDCPRPLSPGIAKGVAYFVTDGVHAVDVSSGERLWQVEDIIAANVPSISKGTVYIGSADGKVHAIE